MTRNPLIKTCAFQLVILVLGIIGMFSLLLCLQTPQLRYYSESTDNDTIFSSGGFENYVAALRCNTRKPQLTRTNNSSTATNFAEAAEVPPFLCFKFISKIHNKTDISLHLNHNCDFIVHTAPPRAGPYSFIA